MKFDRKIFKRIFAAFIILVVTLSMVPSQVFAEAEPQIVNLALEKNYIKTVAPTLTGDWTNYLREDTNDAELTDGIIPSANYWGDSGWVHWIGPAPEIIIDLGGVKEITSFEIVTLSHVDASNFILPSNVKISTSYNDSTYEEVETVSYPSSSELATPTVYTLSYTPDNTVKGKYVKFSFPAGWTLIGEIKIMGIAEDVDPDDYEVPSDPYEGKTNFAYGKAYHKSITPTADGSYMDAIRADTDDVELTNGIIPAPAYWSEYGWVHWIGSAPEITVNLGSKEVFDTFDVVALSHFSADGFILPKNVKISVSDNNFIFKDVATVNFPGETEVTSATSYKLTYTHPTKVAGQYVKFAFPAGWNLLGELKVWGIEGDEPTEELPTDQNFAIGKKYIKSVAPTLTGDYMDAIRMDTDDAELTNGIIPTPDYWKESGWVHWIGTATDIIVDLEKSEYFNRFEIVALSHFSADGFILPTDVTIYVSNDNLKWTQVTRENFPGASQVTTPTAYTLAYQHSAALKARYVKFSLPNGWNLIGEIKVIKTVDCPSYISPDDEVNLVEGKEYTLYAEDESGKEYTLADIDEDNELTNGVKEEFLSFEKENEDLFITATFDLDFIKAVRNVNVSLCELSDDMALPSNVKIEVSDSSDINNAEWVQVVDKAVADADDLNCDMPDEAMTARFVRVTLTQNSKYMPLTEIEITGKGNTDGATSPSDYFARSLIKLSEGMDYKAYVSDDENKLTDGEYGSFVQFDFNNPSQSIEFDFGEIRYVNSVSVNVTKDSLPYRMQISVSEDGKNWEAVLAQKEAFSKDDTYQYKFFSANSRKAQYVMIYMQKSGGVTLVDEIEIWGNDKSEPSAIIPDIPDGPSNPSIKEGYAVPEDSIRSVALIDSDLQWDGEVLTEYAELFDAFCITGNNKKAFENRGFVIVSEDDVKNVSDNLNEAREENLGVYIDMNGDYLDKLDALVEAGAQGRYVFKVIKAAPLISDYEYECTEKLIAGTLKKTNSEAAVTPVAETVTSSWIGFAEVDGYEYSVDGETFTIDPVFTDLSSDTNYTLYQRIRGTATKEPSAKAVLEIKTAKDPEESSSGGNSGGGSSGGGGGSHGGITQPPSTTDKPTVSGWKDGAYYENDEPVSGIKKIGDDIYYLNTSGVPQKGWIKSGGKWYYADTEGLLQIGWFKVKNTWYYSDTNGVMQTGWLKGEGNWYYLHTWGGMANTEWVKVSGKWYYLKGNGVMATGWIEQSANWYYLNSDGDMKTGWLKDSENWYYLKSNGEMAIGWNWVGDSCYYFYGSGKMASNTTIGNYRISSNGAMIQ